MKHGSASLVLAGRPFKIERGLEDLDVELIDRVVVGLDLGGGSQLARRERPTALSSRELASAAIRASCGAVP